MRVGTGYDVHPLVEGRKLILGGVEVPYDYGLMGHSDADVLIHAVMDALLGAGGLGVIGSLFPDDDPQYKDISSLILLNRVQALLEKENYSVVNIDSIIVAEKPKLYPYLGQMRANISRTLKIELDKISVKATTTEGLGFEGKKEGISAHAVCLLETKT